MFIKIIKIFSWFIRLWQTRESVKCGGFTRSHKWKNVRKEFLTNHPTCAICGGKENLQVHHIRPFHLFPDLELFESNLMTLCEGSKNHHLEFGHLENFKSYNPSIKEDATVWYNKIKNRPQ
jgi:5-methylcytosine-specific restriction endonuclease McrA